LTGTQRRKQKIYERRVARRAAKRAERNKTYGSFYWVFQHGNVDRGFRDIRKKLVKCADGIWYCVHAPINEVHTCKKLMNGTYKFRPLRKKHIKQRGKPRDIGIGAAEDRVVLSTLTTHCLMPMIEPRLINTCTAGRPNMGPEVAMLQLEEMLKDHYREHGTDGYVLIFDIRNYYGSIDRDKLGVMLRKVIKDQRLIRLIEDSNDVAIPDSRIGINLGSSTSTMLAALYMSGVDHYMKEVLRLRYYGRHGDDGFIIHHDKEFLLSVLDALREKTSELGLELHPKKTQIIKLTKGFRWLKVKWKLKETGYVVKKMNHDIVTRDSKKMKKCLALEAEGLTTMNYIRNSVWKGWLNKSKNPDLIRQKPIRKGFKKRFRYDNYFVRIKMANRYYSLFGEWEGCNRDVFYQIIGERRSSRSRAA